MRTHLVRLKAKEISYRCFKNFNDQSFLEELSMVVFKCDQTDPNKNYEELVSICRKVIDKHAPLKTKFVRGNEAPFMNKELRKAIYSRSRLKNNFNKNKTKENNTKYRK